MQVGNSWRTTEDIAPNWPSMLVNLDDTVGLAKYAGPGGWNDPDILEVRNIRGDPMPSQTACCRGILSTSQWHLAAVAHVPACFPHDVCHCRPHAVARSGPGPRCCTGTVDLLEHGCPCLQVGNGGLTLNEQRSHFALWALLKSPLMVGTDLAKLPPEGFRILLAKEVIAVNQDPLGVAGDLVWKEGPSEVRPPSTGSPRSPSVRVYARRFEQFLSECRPLMLLSATGYAPPL